MKVLVVDRELPLAQRTVEMIAERGGEAAAMAADLTVSADCASVVDAAVSRFGRLDILDNNVGIGSRLSVVDEDEDNWKRVMDVNVTTHVPHVQARHPEDEGDRRRRRHHQHLVHLRHPAQGTHRVLHLQGRGAVPDPGHGGGPRQGRDPRQLQCCPGPSTRPWSTGAA